MRTPVGEQELQSPLEQEQQNDTFSWQPTNWYKPVWRKMKAFALPSVSDGYIRINVKGREKEGLIDPQDYDAVCDEITEMLMQAIDARTGEKIISKVLRVRKTPFETNSRQSPADLIVLFWEEMPTDTVDSPTLGRIGPLPFFRPGGHQKQGSTIRNCFMVRPAELGQLAKSAATDLLRMCRRRSPHSSANHWRMAGMESRCYDPRLAELPI